MSASLVPLQNVYYERKTATPKQCYICRRLTQTVLATLKTDDFLYTCDSHLTDPGFASLIAPPPPAEPAGPTAEDIRKVIAEHQAREAKSTDKSTDPKDKDKTDSSKSSTPPVPAPIPVPVPAPTATGATPSTAPSTSASHRKFALHRSIFDMRRNEIKRREQVGKAKEVSKGMPQVPRGAF